MAAFSGNALARLSADYLSSDSSDDEVVPGPRVSTKRGTPKDWAHNSSKKKAPLPLPVSLTSLFPTSNMNDHVDDVSLHDGRIRSFAHERGNWSTFVHIPYDTSPEFQLLVNTITAECEPEVHLKPVDDVHISLTRTVVLRHHWIDLFVQSLRECLILIPSFAIYFDSVEVYCNEEKTRTFIGLKLPSHCVPKDLVGLMDKCLAEFKLPPFYDNPSFHLSIAWCVGDYKLVLQELMPKLQVVFHQFVLEHSDFLNRNIRNLICKTGNKRFVLPLS